MKFIFLFLFFSVPIIGYSDDEETELDAELAREPRDFSAVLKVFLQLNVLNAQPTMQDIVGDFQELQSLESHLEATLNELETQDRSLSNKNEVIKKYRMAIKRLRLKNARLGREICKIIEILNTTTTERNASKKAFDQLSDVAGILRNNLLLEHNTNNRLNKQNSELNKTLESLTAKSRQLDDLYQKLQIESHGIKVRGDILEADLRRQIDVQISNHTITVKNAESAEYRLNAGLAQSEFKLSQLQHNFNAQGVLLENSNAAKSILNLEVQDLQKHTIDLRAANLNGEAAKKHVDSINAQLEAEISRLNKIIKNQEGDIVKLQDLIQELQQKQASNDRVRSRLHWKTMVLVTGGSSMLCFGIGIQCGAATQPAPIEKRQPAATFDEVLFNQQFSNYRTQLFKESAEGKIYIYLLHDLEAALSILVTKSHDIKLTQLWDKVRNAKSEAAQLADNSEAMQTLVKDTYSNIIDCLPALAFGLKKPDTHDSVTRIFIIAREMELRHPQLATNGGCVSIFR